MMLSETATADVMQVLQTEDFYRPAHGLIFDVITNLFGGGNTADPVVIATELEKRGKLRNVGGAPYLFELLQACPSATNATYYAKAVARKAQMRRLVETGVRWQQLGYSDTATQEELDLVIAQAEEFLKGVKAPSEEGIMFGDLTREWQTFQSKPEDILATPWCELTEYLGGGFRRSKLYVIAGRPGSGKSMGGLNIALHIAESGLPVTVFSLEMGKLEVAGRLLASGAWANYGEIFRKRMSGDTRDRVAEYIDSNQAMNLEIVDKAAITVEQIVAHIKSRKPAAVFIDYCQLITGSFRGDRREVVDHITRSLKVCAADTNTAIILASQVNRNGADRMPTIADLRESGSIENDADCVLLLYREDEGSGTVKLSIGKNRDGKMGTLEMVWRGDLARIG
jgi:replicative DNA helicase